MKLSIAGEGAELLPMRYRVLLFLLSVCLACGLFMLLGQPSPAIKVLGRWFSGLAWIFLLLFTVLGLLALRGRSSQGWWIFPIFVGLSYLAGMVSDV